MTTPLVDLAVARDGLVVPVSARPRARCDAITGVRNGALLIETTAAPEAGAANEAIRRVLAEALGVARTRIELSKGGASRHKRFTVAGLSIDAARERLEPWITGAGRG